MAKRNGSAKRKERRSFDREFKEQAVQMMLDGHSASSVSGRLGIDNTNLGVSAQRWVVLHKGTQTLIGLTVGSQISSSLR